MPRPRERIAGGEIVLSVSRPVAVQAASARLARRCCDGVSFDLHAGEILGIGGLLGSGRTEILETIFGSSERPRRRRDPARRRAGRHPLAARCAPARPRAGHRGPQDARACICSASITDNVALPLVGRLARFGIRSFAGEAALARNAVETLGIRCSGIEQAAGTLSGGNQQKVVIGKWLATRPRVLLLDEPTRGIDVGAKREIYDLIFRLAREGLAIVVVSSELPELLLLADRILVMSEGRQTGMLDARRGERGAHHAACRAARQPRGKAAA